MKKMAIAVFAVMLFVAMATMAKADRYFTGDLSYNNAYNVDHRYQMCANFSQFADSGRVYFNLDTCNPNFYFGFTGDGRVSVSIQKGDQQAYIVSRDSARGLRNEVEHAATNNVSNETFTIVQALGADRVIQKQNESAANDYRASKLKKIDKKESLGKDISMIGTIGSLVNLLNGKKDPASRLVQSEIWQTGTGLVLGLTGTSEDELTLRTAKAALTADCIATGGCQQ